MNILFRISLILALIFAIAGCSKRTIRTINIPDQERGFDTTQYNLLYADAIKQKMLGNIGDAIKYFEQALNLNPGSDASSFQISQIAAGRGDFVSAKKYAVKAHELDRSNRWYILNVANIYYVEQRLDSVAYYYEKLIDLDPEEEDIRFNLGSIYTELGDYAKAEEVFTHFTDNYGDNPEIMIALVKVYQGQNRLLEAENLLLKLIEIEPDNNNYLGLLAEYYRSVSRDEDALSVYNTLFEKDPGNALLQLSYLDYLLSTKSYDELTNFLNTVIINENVLKSDKINIFTKLLGEKELLIERENEILFSTMVLLTQYSKDADVVILVSKIYGNYGESDKQIALLEGFISDDETNYYIWEHLLLTLNETGDNEKLFKMGKRASTLFNRVPLPKLLYSFAATEKGDYEVALSELRKVRILVNEQPEYMVQILSLEADIFYRQGDYIKAFKSFDDALLINPEDQLILNNYAYFMAEKDYDLKRALELIEKALSIETNATYLDTYAWVLYKNQKYKRAEEIMEKIFEADDIVDPELLEHFGYIRFARKDCKSAVIYWRMALEKDPTKLYLGEEIYKCDNR